MEVLAVLLCAAVVVPFTVQGDLDRDLDLTNTASVQEQFQAVLTELAQLRIDVSELRRLHVVGKQHVRRERPERQVTRPVWQHCPNGFVRNDNSCFHVSILSASWPEAYAYCDAYGSNLASFESDRQQKFMDNYLKVLKNGTTEYWIGGTDAVTEGQWIWAKSAARVSGFTAWGPGQPNDVNPLRSHHQDCMQLLHYSAGFLWDDDDCHKEHNFICEIKIQDDAPSAIG